MDILEKARQYEDINRVSEKVRPLFHVTPPVGWVNDPNGFSVYQGKVHLFYQYHPYSTGWGPMHWGHQVTEDFVQWHECPAALAPDKSYDSEGCFSGSGIETDEGHVLVYTGVTKEKDGKGNIQNQCIAIGDGINYKKIPANPVISGDMLPEGFSREDFRDPKIWKEDGIYYIVAGNRDGNREGQVVLFASEDLYNWNYKGVLAHSRGNVGSMWECPDFFGLDGKHVLICSPQDMEAKGYEFHSGNNSVYYLGNYDKESMTFSSTGPFALDYGLDFYAPQTTLMPDGRRIMVAWMQSWDSIFAPASHKWHGIMTFPRELDIENNRLIQRPARELENYYTNKVIYKDEVVEGSRYFDSICGRAMDLAVEINPGTFHEFIIDLARNEKYYTRIVFNKDKDIIETDRTFSGMVRDVACIRRARAGYKDGTIKLRFIMDYNSVELFVNNGETVLSTVIYTPLEAQGVLFTCDGRITVNIEKYDIVV